MTGKASKVTLKSLQSEMNNIKEELESVKTELRYVKNELADVKDKQRKVNGNEQMKTIETVNIENNFTSKICNICVEIYNLKRDLMLHVKEKHPKKVICKSCDEIFYKNSDLEEQIKSNQ